MSNQGKRQESVRAQTGTAFTYEGDWHALFDMAGIPVGTYNERLLAWINDYMGESFTELNGAMAAFAIDQGYSDWDSMGTFDAAGFSPADIPNLSLWLDASDLSTITQTGGNVSAWADKSGNGYNATQGTGANQPLTQVDTINGKNSITFDGVNDSLSLSAGILSVTNGDYTIYFAARKPVTGNGGYAYGFENVSLTTAWRYDFSDTVTQVSAGASPVNNFTYTSNTNPHLSILRKEGSVAQAWRDSQTGATFAAANFTALTAVLGASGTSAIWTMVCMGEVIIYNRALTPAEDAQIRAYIQGKWGTP